jgi:cephalosporin-C deacetylase-like acetyl esterase
VPDAVFEVYKDQFSYDETDLDARTEMRDESPEDWTKERVTFNAAYGGERVIANVFLPKNTPPPFQTVVYFPGDNATMKSTSRNVEEDYDFNQYLEAIVKNGRAVVYPVYEGTFERREADPPAGFLDPQTHQYTEFFIRVVKDFKRSVDYLETRADIDTANLSYCGFSWGGVMGCVIPAVEDRLDASMVILGGLPYWENRPESDEINYVTHVRTPTLMLNGKYDFTLGLDTCVRPMYELLGTPDEHKRLKVYETDHFVPRNEVIKETMTWLDRYLGPVR